MTERPILFNDAMVRAILSGAKTQTRRRLLVGGAPVHSSREGNEWRKLRDGWAWCVGDNVLGGVYSCPFGVPGDHLWVRECWQIVTGRESGDLGAVVRYRADNEMQSVTMPIEKPMPLGLTWDRHRPSIHMPRWASRLTLRVTDVRVERVQDITEADSIAEGAGIARIQDARAPSRGPIVDAFSNLWDAAYPGSWDRNDWVWVVTFEKARGG